MMKYTVLSEFADLLDNNHIYNVGDEYPREGYSPEGKRIEQLSTSKNLLNKPLIQKIADPVVENEEPQEEEVLPKRKRGKKNTDD